MSNVHKSRGVDNDFRISSLMGHSQLDSEIVKSARAAISGIVQAGFEGVSVVNIYNKETGKTERTFLIDVSTIEGQTAAGIWGSLSTAAEPFDPNFVLNKLVFDYICLGLPLPNPAAKGKVQQQ